MKTPKIKYNFIFLLVLIIFIIGCNKSKNITQLSKIGIYPTLPNKTQDSLFKELLYWQYRDIKKLKKTATELLQSNADSTALIIGEYYLEKAIFYENFDSKSIINFKTIFKKIKDEKLNFIKYEICFFVNNYYNTEDEFIQNVEWVDNQFYFLSNEDAKIERTAIIYNLAENFELNYKERREQLLSVEPLLKKLPWGFYHTKLYKDLSYTYRSEGNKEKEIELLRFVLENNLKNGLTIFACDNYMQIGYVLGGDSGVVYLKKAMQLAEKTGYTASSRNLNTVLGNIYLASKNYSLSFDAYNNSLKIDSSSNKHFDKILDLTYAGQAYYLLDTSQNYPTTKEKYFDKAYALLANNDYNTRKAFLEETLKFTSSKITPLKLQQIKNEINEAQKNAKKSDAVVNNFYLSMRLKQKENEVKITELNNKNKVYNDKLFYQNLAIILIILFFIALSIYYLQKLKSEKKLNEVSEIIELQNAKLKQLIKQLKKSNENLENFAQIAAHDLQSPLLNIKTGLLILKKELSEKLNSHEINLINQINLSTNSFLELISGLLNFSRVTQNLGEPNDVNLNIELNSIIDNLQLQINEKNAQIKKENELPVLFAHKTLILQLFLNVINNSLKYTKPEKLCEISIGSKPTNDGGVQIYVKDNGIGIQENKLKNIFNLFSIGHTSNLYSGNGIGLAICEKVVEFYKGKIWVESEFGNGTTVNIYFPKNKI